MEEEINKLVKSADFCSEDGTAYSMFSQQRNNGDANEGDDLIVRQPKNLEGNLDEDETPPGCEELLFPSELQSIIGSSLKTFSNSALIGLEYIVEVHPDDTNRTARIFYICVLCEKRCDILDSIMKHMESSGHRLTYLRKYFPRAYSLFLQADPCVENWTTEIHEYMEAVISRIESLKGRLQALPCHRTRWDVQCQHFRTEINRGIHLRETPDLFYYDISTPLTATKFGIEAINGKTGDCNGSQSDMMLANSKKNINSGKIDFFENDSSKRLEHEAVIVLSDDSLSEAECEKVDVFSISTSQNLNKPEGSGGTVSSKILKKTLWPINPISQSGSVNHKEDITTKQSTYHTNIVSDDDIVVEKEIFGKEIVPKSNISQQPELCSSLGSRLRSPKRSGIDSVDRNTTCKYPSPKRLRSSFSSRDRNIASKSRSQSPKQLRSKFSSSRQQHPKHRERHRHASTVKGVRNLTTGIEHLGNQRGREPGLASPMRLQHEGKNIRKESRLWKKFEKELDSFKEKLRRKQKIYKERPEDHPLYADEWKAFWTRRWAELEKEGKKPARYDMKRDWFPFWFSRMKILEKKEIKTKKVELKKKYGLLDGGAHHDNCEVEKEPTTTESLKNREPIRFGWKNHTKKSEVTLHPTQNLKAVLNQTKNLSNDEDALMPTKRSPVVSSPNAYSFEELRVFQNPKPVCHVVGNISQILKDAPLSSDPNLLQVLRMLVALEDSLGSLGPSVTNLLTRALSAERCEIGSSSKLLRDDATCVDLLDTSKEKLKGLLLAGILDGVKGTAASKAVEYVTRLLKQSSNTSPSCTPMEGPVEFDMASLINNLQAAGLLRPIESTPTLPSSIESFRVAEVKDKNSTQSINNLHGSRFEKCDKFTGEELKTLILNFRTLTESQKRDLVKYLQQLEEAFPEKKVANQSRAVLSPSPLPSSSSPLSKKYRQYQSCRVINPMAPAPPSKTRYPTILKMTGLSCVDLKNHGIPLDELDSPCTSTQVDSRLCPSNDEISTASHPPYPSQLNASRPSHLVQSLKKSPHLGTLQWGGASVQQNSFIQHFIEEQPSSRDEIYLVESVSRQQHSLRPQQCNGSFCYQQLDPRRNRMHQRNEKKLPSDSLYSSQKSQDPVIIPTSPISQRIPLIKDILELSSDSWRLNHSSESSSPSKRKENRYW